MTETRHENALPSPKERRRLREAGGLSEQQVAEAVGVTRATVRSWETGRTSPRGRKRDAYAKLLTELGAGPDRARSRTEDHAGRARPADAERTRTRTAAASGTDGADLTSGTSESPGADATSGASGADVGDASARDGAERAGGERSGAGHGGRGHGKADRPGSRPRPAAKKAAKPPNGPAPVGLPVPAAHLIAFTGPAQRALPARTAAPALASAPRKAAISAAPAPRRQTAGATATAVRERGDAENAGARAAGTADEAFDALYSRAAPALVRQTYLLTGRRRLSEESVEHAFLLAWQRWPEVAVDRDPAGWVRAAAYEYALSPWHRLRRAHRHPDGGDGDARSLRRALLDLPPAYRRSLLLYDGLGMDLPETAAETEASTPAAANRILHARAALAERVPGLGGDEELSERLGSMVGDVTPVKLPSAASVRGSGERRAKVWTRAAIAFTALILGATAFTLATAPTRYEAPQSPPETVGGVPPRMGPQPLTPDDVRLRELLRSETANGPERLVPDGR
ncbi:sigma factor-like helix-turn-helix DNA-binding protein [Streptomyces sp. NPDC001941]|uniref:sigma factor-like helix-turn-helix DNA-binding protein n=1 Tax=Streptomyces sp. NPDC001941 TaxID=3154659 RepID=UPI0033314170